MPPEQQPFWLDPQPFRPRETFSIKPQQNELNRLLEEGEKEAAKVSRLLMHSKFFSFQNRNRTDSSKFWRDFIAKVKEAFILDVGVPGDLPYEEWFFRAINIGEEERAVIIRAEWIKKYTVAVIGWEDTKRGVERAALREVARKEMEKAGMSY
ncbi:MAG: hypothetical protein Q9169_002141 [Polycauliona sp. 2 TL-2023]